MALFNCMKLLSIFNFQKEIWTNARRVNKGWRFRGEGNIQVPSDQIIDIRDERLRCLMYSINREKYIPVSCEKKVTALCVYAVNSPDVICAGVSNPNS